MKEEVHSLTLEVRAVDCRLPLKGFNITVEIEPVLGTKVGGRRELIMGRPEPCSSLGIPGLSSPGFQ